MVAIFSTDSPNSPMVDKVSPGCLPHKQELWWELVFSLITSSCGTGFPELTQDLPRVTGEARLTPCGVSSISFSDASALHSVWQVSELKVNLHLNRFLNCPFPIGKTTCLLACVCTSTTGTLTHVFPTFSCISHSILDFEMIWMILF